MDTLNLRFQHLSESIFSKLDDQSLVKCKEVSRNWYDSINDRKVQWIKMIEKNIINTTTKKEKLPMIDKNISDDEKMFKFWRSVISKTPTEFTKEFAVEFEKFYKKIGLIEENYYKNGKATYYKVSIISTVCLTNNCFDLRIVQYV